MAAVFMIVLIIASIPLGIVKSMQGLKSEVEDEFYYDDTGLALYECLDIRVSTSENLIKVAEKYSDDYPELKTYIEDLSYCTKKLEKISLDKNTQAILNKELDKPFEDLAEKLQSIELDEADAKYPGSLWAEMKSQADKLARSSYNTKVDEYNKVVKGFPVNVMYKLGLVKELETFR